jgi:hypothetical protein
VLTPVLLLETGVGLRFFIGISAALENEHRYFKMIPPSLLVSYYGGAWFGSQLRTPNEHHSKCFFQARSLLLQGGGLVGPSPRASNEV